MSTSSTLKKGFGGLLAVAIALTLTLASASTALASSEVIDRIVAQVNDEIITQYEVEKAAVPYLVQHGRNPAVLADDDQNEELLEEVLDDMINRLLIEEQANEMGLEVSNEQVEEWMQMTAQQQNMTTEQFRQLIAQQGIDHDEYYQIVRDNLLRMQLMQARGQTGAAVSDDEVRQMYREHFGAEPEEPEVRLEMRHILLVPDEASGSEQEIIARLEEMRSQIEAGEASFEELARTYSQGPGAEDGGNIGTFGRGELAPSFEEAAFSQPEDVLSEPVETEFGYHLIEVVDRQEMASDEVEQRKEQIRAHLMEQEMERQLDSYLENVRARAFVDVRW